MQTLHPEHFDHGLILAQTAQPGLDVPEETTPDALTHRLGLLGGQMLVDVLRNGLFIPPLKEAGWYGGSGGPVDHAEKITPAHRHVDFSTATAQDILTRHHVLGDLWTILPNGERVIFNKISTHSSGHGKPGLFVRDDSQNPAIRTADGQVLEIQSSTCAGGKKGKGNAHLRRILAS